MSLPGRRWLAAQHFKIQQKAQKQTLQRHPLHWIMMISRYHVWNPWYTLFLTSSAGSVVLFFPSLISSVLLFFIFFCNLFWSILLLFSPVWHNSVLVTFPLSWDLLCCFSVLFFSLVALLCLVCFILSLFYKKQTLIYFTRVSPSLQSSLLPVLLVAITPVNQISFLIFNFRYSDFDILFLNIFNLLAWSTNVLLCYNPMGWSAQLQSGSSSDCLSR